MPTSPPPSWPRKTLTAAGSLLKTALLAESIERANAVEGLRSTATACETIDRREEALVSAGWGRVGNAHYYEDQLAVISFPANGPTSCLFSGHPVGLVLQAAGFSFPLKSGGRGSRRVRSAPVSNTPLPPAPPRGPATCLPPQATSPSNGRAS